LFQKIIQEVDHSLDQKTLAGPAISSIILKRSGPNITETIGGSTRMAKARKSGKSKAQSGFTAERRMMAHWLQNKVG
jgi:hypothetical protein